MLFGKRARMINRILIVEDEPLVAFDNEHFLRDAGYVIVGTVDTVAEAVAAFEQEIDLAARSSARASGCPTLRLLPLLALSLRSLNLVPWSLAQSHRRHHRLAQRRHSGDARARQVPMLLQRPRKPSSRRSPRQQLASRWRMTKRSVDARVHSVQSKDNKLMKSGSYVPVSVASS